jgi:uncharacterized protein YbaP (TraB family)
MIQRRLLVTLLAVATVASCKGSSKSDKAEPNAGSASRIKPVPVPPVPATAPTGSGSAIDPAPAPGSPITRPFFYRVEKDGKTSYLIGTWHNGVDAEKQLPEAVWTALSSAKSFAMEMDPTDPLTLTGAKRTDGTTLEQELGAEYWARLEALAGNTVQAMRGMKPFGAAMMLQFKDLPPTPSMDVTFATKARDAKKQLAFLEPAAHQIKLLEKWIDTRVLKHMIDDYDANKRMLEDALVAYMVGDDAALAAMAVPRDTLKEAGFSDAEVDQMTSELIYERNAAWLGQLEGLLAAGDAFVAVGAAHLIGPKSVVELLGANGYKISRVGG